MFVHCEELDLLEFENEEEVIEFFHEALGSVEHVESFLGIEFAFADGTYKSDGVPVGEDEVEWEKQGVDFSKYRQDSEEVKLPNKYPAKICYGGFINHKGYKNIFYKWID